MKSDLINLGANYVITEEEFQNANKVKELLQVKVAVPYTSIVFDNLILIHLPGLFLKNPYHRLTGVNNQKLGWEVSRIVIIVVKQRVNGVSLESRL